MPDRTINEDCFAISSVVRGGARLHRTTAALVASFGLVLSAQAADIQSSYGMVRALPASTGRFTVSLDEKPLAVIAAEEVSLLRVSPHGRQEYILIEKWRSGLNCHKSYMILAITPDKKSTMSPSFGECAELEGATYLKDGVIVKLRAVKGRDGKRPKIIRYTWANGRLARH